MVRCTKPAAVADTARRGTRRQRHDKDTTDDGGETTRPYETHAVLTVMHPGRFREITRTGQVSPPMSVSYAS
ncbi:hypothetical protein GCM10009687_52670 [Asanoa iriomotensis]|uniref:Uncharacterized protein n=1 Tax=Asanoa iriomotensis TaxID=234613 RepID=A0ABQ4BVS1_9ACTN|nr:hypothetical protein Air01nite_06970 [Asanoa iriomotensis]